MITILFDGIAYGMLLFVLACGLSVTLGLMNFVNLAHGVFALVGGYVTAWLMNEHGVSFFLCLPAAFAAGALAGAASERLVFRRLYRRSHLDQVLFTIGIVFMTVAAVEFLIGPQQQRIDLPPELRGRVDLLGGSIGVYRLFIIVLCGCLALALHMLLVTTRFGSRLRAAVDYEATARGLGIRVDAVFATTFVIGSGLAGLGGALGADILGMDPHFPLEFLVYFLIVVGVGGTTGIAGAFVASLLLGIADVAGKYYVPEVGAFIIYAVMVAVLIARPQGLFARGR